MFVVYSNQEAKMRDILSFLKAGFDNNELLFIMMESLPKVEVFNRIAKEWDIGDTKKLEGINDEILITTPKEWCYHNGDFNTFRILKKW